MLGRIKTLVLLQIGDRLTKAKRRKLIQTLISILVKIVIIGAITFGLQFILNFAKSTLYIPVNKNILIFIVFITQLISIIACTMGLITALYKSKDNQILLAYPVHHDEVFISKLAVFYIRELYRSLFFLIPFLLSFGMVNSVPISFYFLSLIFIIVLPLFPVLIGALISLPVMYISHIITNYKIATGGFVAVCGVAIYYITRLIIKILPEPPLRILALYNKFLNGLIDFVNEVVKYALYYNNVGNILFTGTRFIDLVILFATLGVLIVLVFTVTKITYFRLASFSSEIASKKIHKNRNTKVHKNTFFTFVKKEMIITRRSVTEMLSNYGFLVALPIVLYLVNYIYCAITKTILGNDMVVGFNLLIGLMMITAANSLSASSVTSEGLEFQILKTAPSDTYKMAWAKITLNLVISLFFISLSVLILGLFTDIYLQDLLFIYLVYVLVDLGHIFWSIQLDILNPKLHDYVISGNIDDNSNVGRSVLYGILLALFFGGVSFILLYDDYSSGWLRLILLAVAFFVVRLYLFINYLKVYFKEIEM